VVKFAITCPAEK